jgi:hypothetical protein
MLALFGAPVLAVEFTKGLSSWRATIFDLTARTGVVAFLDVLRERRTLRVSVIGERRHRLAPRERRNK